MLRAQCVQHASLVIQGILPLGCDESIALPPFYSPLLQFILNQSLPRGFLHELVVRTHSNQEAFGRVFTPLLQSLYLMMQNATLVKFSHRQPIHALEELVEIRCGPNGNLRPLCRLIVAQTQFMPELVTPVKGRELTRTSFFGPFLSVSTFAEDQPKVNFS